MNMDAVTITSALLHDTIEDVEEVTTETIKMEFGSEVAKIVYGVTKITNINKNQTRAENFNENLRKMILFTAKDIRVVIIKMADRLHNMRTLSYCAEDKQRRIALETRDIYAPLANRLGLYNIKSELEDLTMKYLEADTYDFIEKHVIMKHKERDKLVFYLSEYLRKILNEREVKFINISGRSKHYYSIYRKMKKGYNFDEIYDLTAVRVITSDISQCYTVLGVVHNVWTAVPDRFKDYISNPKENGYQSLHTTVVTHTGKLAEIQIRTQKMHEVAEEGIAAHWKYKENIKGDDKQVKYIEENLRWVRRIKNWAQEMRNRKEDFVDELKTDILEDQILCYTPTGEVFDLPKDATPIDFAYHIHTDIGDKCSAARVTRNDASKLLPLSAPLQSFDIVEIITNNHSHPAFDWLNYVKTSRAKNKIKQWFRSHQYRDKLDKGRDLFIQVLKNLDIPSDSPMKDKIVQQYIKAQGRVSNEEGVMVDIGFSDISESDLIKKVKQYIEIINTEEIAQRIFDEQILEDLNNSEDDIIMVDGMSNIPVKIAKCCEPVLGDSISGFVTRLSGVSIHKSNCKNFLQLKENAKANGEESRIVTASWRLTDISKPVRAELITTDDDNTLHSISDIVRRSRATIIRMNTYKLSYNRNKVALVIRTVNTNKYQKAKLIKSLKTSKYVLKANIIE
jgi:GTP pyrophosphokinase